MNIELASLIEDYGDDLLGYLKLRARYVLTCFLGDPLVLADISEFGGEGYLRQLADAGLLEFVKDADHGIYTIYLHKDGGWIGGKKMVAVPEFRKHPPSLLQKILVYVARPADYYHQGAFNKKYPKLLAELRRHFTDKQILSAAKVAGKSVPLNQFLTNKWFWKYHAAAESMPKSRCQETYVDEAW